VGEGDTSISGAAAVLLVVTVLDEFKTANKGITIIKKANIERDIKGVSSRLCLFFAMASVCTNPN